MGNMPVIKDLVVDMSSFWNHLRRLSPTLVLVYNPERGLQTPKECSLIRLATLWGLLF